MGLSKKRKKMHDAIRELGRADAYEVYSGKVKSVDEGKATCVVTIDDDLDIPEVRLRAVITDDTGLWVLPKVGSFVIIALIDGGVDYVLVRPSEIDKVFIKIGAKTLEISTDGFSFNGGENDGLVKVAELVDKLNAIENKVNSMATVINTHVHSGGILTGGLTGPASPPNPVAGTLNLTQKTDLENTDVKH